MRGRAERSVPREELIENQPSTPRQPQCADDAVNRQALSRGQAHVMRRAASTVHGGSACGAGRTKRGLPQRHEPAYALGDVLRGECGAGNILDVRTKTQLLEAVAPAELLAPGRISHFAPMAFAV